MPKIRVRSAKRGTKGSYNQGRKLSKEKNHTHNFVEIQRPNRIITICSIPNCKSHTVRRI